MNYLKLCQQANLYGGFQGTISSVNASGYQALLVDAVQKAWVDIQNERNNWDFMYTGVDIPITSVTNEYTPADIFGSTVTLGRWDHRRIIYNYRPLRYIPYADFILIEDVTSGEPQYFTERPSDQALLFNTVDANYTITAQYTKTPQILINNTDTPSFPVKHHNIIVYAAVLDLAAYVSSTEIYQKNQINYSKAMGQLMRDHVPAKTIKQRPLA